MSISHKAGLALVVLGTLGQTISAHAMGTLPAGINVTSSAVTGGGGSPFTYSYDVTPNFNANQFSTDGIGWDRPFDPEDPNNHAKNRRVEIKVIALENPE